MTRRSPLLWAMIIIAIISVVGLVVSVYQPATPPARPTGVIQVQLPDNRVVVCVTKNGIDCDWAHVK